MTLFLSPHYVARTIEQEAMEVNKSLDALLDSIEGDVIDSPQPNNSWLLRLTIWLETDADITRIGTVGELLEERKARHAHYHQGA